jgi:hypothetical protein
LLPASPRLGSAAAGPPELMERGKLRVCDDGNNLPVSNRAGEGFENKIAESMAEDLGLRIHQTRCASNAAQLAKPCPAMALPFT